MSRRDEVIDAAERILEAEGFEALTMRRLGAELSMRAPSLYKHVAGKPEVEAALQERALRGIGAALAAAGPTLGDLAAAYRAWSLAHPRLYELSTRRPLQRDCLASGVEAAAAAPLLAAVGGDQAAARALWGLAHGLVDLELAGRFPPDADLSAAWSAAVHAFGGG
ncbi:TetR/AcrR family transcriptional regulator [Micromonospora sp. NPDC092111]|uniref:TetR/AcrR family transcriptional regulator n=1 Tax=Micromonospora sp. NPDC092111 TaxID=3364289 RepID=UPI003800CB61